MRHGPKVSEHEQQPIAVGSVLAAQKNSGVFVKICFLK